MVFVAIALVIGWSRVHVRVHYPTDILGGIVVGMGAAYTVAMLIVQLA
jgi:membrane-associated phospholipid phosphatase